MSETVPSPEQSICAVYADVYYYQLYLYHHPEAELAYVAIWWGVPPERVGRLPEWNDNRLKSELNCTVRTVCREALKEQNVMSRDETPTDEQMHNAHVYVSDQWEIGKSTAQELIDKEPALNEYDNPMRNYEAFKKVWRSTQKNYRDLPLSFFGINIKDGNPDQ